jgi:TonB family protein
MKSLLYGLVCLVAFSLAEAQSSLFDGATAYVQFIDEEDKYHNLDKNPDISRAPQFPQGNEALANYIKSNLAYPENAFEYGVEGVVMISFVINENGRPMDFNILDGPGFGCNEEAMRLATLMPHWIPGLRNGKTVSMKVIIPISFKLY